MKPGLLATLISLLIVGQSALAAEPLVCVLPKKIAGLSDWFSPVAHLALTSSGMEWNGDPVSAETVEEYLADFIQHEPQPILQLSVRDPNTSYGTVLPLLRDVQRHRLVYLWLETTSQAYIPDDVFIPPGSKVPQTPFTIRCGLWNGDRPTPAPDITLSAAPNGKPIKDGQVMERAAFSRALLQETQRKPQPSILLAPGAHTPYLSFIGLLLDVETSGFTRVQISLDDGSAPAK